MRTRTRILIVLSLLSASTVASVVFPPAVPPPTTLADFDLPGSQPGDSGIMDSPNKCDNCHSGYGEQTVEPAFNWRGGMMAQAMRDPIFLATMTIANQDAPESGDLCIRCHSPKGWLEGRSTPTDGSALTSADREGVQCDFCHRLIKPSSMGANPYPDDPAYTSDTFSEDADYLAQIENIPSHSANGMYVVDAANVRRGPFTDATGRHQQLYSPFHSDAALCGTCHDVSNPVFSRVAGSVYAPNGFGTPPPSANPYEFFPVERTYSEWLMSAYNTLEGVFAPQFGGNKDYVSTCQDCHMKDVTGHAAKQNDAVFRTDLPLHDLTGGNTFIPGLIESTYPGESNSLALEDGVTRARNMLSMAASLQIEAHREGESVDVEVTVSNETGHKLPSGYPEGRRIWLNVRGLDQSGAVVYESGAYDSATAVLSHDKDVMIYEVKPGISQTLSGIVGVPAGPSFHFVLNDTIYSDNRIPPRGFTNSAFESIQSPVVNYAYEDGQYWDMSVYEVPGTAQTIEATLYYQTTSKEYVEFLRDENHTDNWGQRFYDMWSSAGKSPPEIIAHETIVLPSSIQVEVKFWLHGPYDAATSTMRSDLMDFAILPLEQTYGSEPWSYEGTESFSELPTGAVDWVLLSLASGNPTPGGLEVVGSAATILLSDGSLAFPDRDDGVASFAVPTGEYYIIIRHRNHLSAMSSSKILLGEAAQTVDFREQSDLIFGGESALSDLGGNAWGLVSGDADADGNVFPADLVQHWLSESGGSGYLGADFNLDGHVFPDDLIEYWIPNIGRGSFVPSLP